MKWGWSQQCSSGLVMRNEGGKSQANSKRFCTHWHQGRALCLQLLLCWSPRGHSQEGQGTAGAVQNPTLPSRDPCTKCPLHHAVGTITFVMPSTTSMDVTKGFDEPVNSHPTTSGRVRETGRPSITASVSMPPTPKAVKTDGQHSAPEDYVSSLRTSAV